MRRSESVALLVGFFVGCFLLAVALTTPSVNKFDLIIGVCLVAYTVVRWSVR